MLHAPQDFAGLRRTSRKNQLFRTISCFGRKGRGDKRKFIGASLAVLFVLAQSFAAHAGPNASVATPDEEDYLLILDSLSNPALLPPLVDLGLINESLENSIPDIIDEWPTVGVGGCLLSTTAPWKSTNGLRVKGEAGYACGSNRTKISVTVCLQVRGADRWVVMEGSCRHRAAANESVVYKKTSGYCRSGTWKYRTIAVGEATGPNGAQDAAISKSAPSTIYCRTF